MLCHSLKVVCNVVVVFLFWAVSGSLFTLSATPNIDNINPSHGVPGTQVTFTGTGFGASQGSGVVWLSGTTGTVVSWSDTQVVATVTTGALPGQTMIKQNGVWSNQVTFTIDPPTLSSISPTSGLPGMQVTLTGSGFGSAQASGQVWLASNLADSIVSWSDTQIVATVAQGTQPGTAKVKQYGVWSNQISFTMIPPTASTASPNPAAIGAPVTISGSGFGSSQGSGQAWLGSNLSGSILSWSDTQVVATVASGVALGNGNFRVKQNGVWSSSGNITIVAAPIITSLTPTLGISGTSITIAGSNFGSSQGSSTVTFNGVPATPTFWSATSITVPVPSGTSTGNVVVTVAGGNSNGVSFTVPLPPSLLQISPVAGVSGTSITLTGSNFGSSQGSSQALISGLPVSVVTWSDSTITANIPSGVTTGQQLPVTVVTSAGTSNAVEFLVNAPPTGVTLTPSMASMVVGESRTFQAFDSTGGLLTAQQWTSSNPGIVSLSTDDPPVVTALAPGTATITVDDATANITVYAGPLLPNGTVKWSVPGDGSGVTKILPAVPSSTGVADVFAWQNSGMLMAISADGTTAWSAYAWPQGHVLPDFQGGFVYWDGGHVQKFEGTTGEPDPPFNVSPNPSDPSTYISGAVVHTDGTIFAITGGGLVGIDPATGQSKFSIPMEHSTSNYPNAVTDYPAIVVSDPIVAGDGFAYLAYTYKTATYSSDHQHIDAYLKLLRVAANGDFQKIEVKKLSEDHTTTNVQGLIWAYGVYYCEGACASWPGGPFICAQNPTCLSQSTVEVCAVEAGCVQGQVIDTQTGLLSPDPSWPEILGTHLITDADKGVTLSFRVPHVGYQNSDSSALHPCAPNCVGTHTHSDGADIDYLATVSSDNQQVATATVSIPGTHGVLNPTLQRADGSYIGVMQVNDVSWMTSFDKDGDVLWTKQGDYQPLIATPDGGVIARLAASNGVFRVTLDASGNLVSQMADTGRIQSWIGNVYQYGSVEQVIDISNHLAASYLASSSFYFGTSKKQEAFPQLVSCYASDNANPPACPGPRQIIWNAYKALAIANSANGATAILITNKDLIKSKIFDKLNAALGTSYTVDDFRIYLNKGFSPFDGTISTADESLVATGSGGEVQDVFRNPVTHQIDPDSYAATISLKTPLTVFFNPNNFVDLDFGANSSNMGLIFHEGLHGFIGISDVNLQRALGCQVSTPPFVNSLNITDYVSQFLNTPPPAPGNTFDCSHF